MSEEYDLKKSEKKIGQLYPILKSKDGQVIDGFHREKADANWKTLVLPEIDNEEKLLLARLIANFHRRQVSREEKAEWINGLAEIYQKQGLKIYSKVPSAAENEIRNKIAEVTGLTPQTIDDYLIVEFKQELKGGTPKGYQYVPTSQRIETELGSEVAERFRKEVLEEAKLSPKEKAEWINGLAEIYKEQGLKVSGEKGSSAGTAPNEIVNKIVEVTGLSDHTVTSFLKEKFKHIEMSRPHAPSVLASQRIETQLGSEVVERFREQIKQEEKLSPKQKVKLEEERQRQKEERKRKREENKRLKEEKLQKLAEERAKNLKTEELLKDAEFRQQVIREISKPQIVKASESGKIVEEMVSEYAPAIEEAFSKIKKDTNLPEPERNRLVLNMLLKNLQQGLLFCPKCGQRMFECSHCHTSLEKLKEEAKL